MEYRKILSRAWEITWHWKVLWVLGLLVNLGNSGSQSSSGESEGGLICIACLGFVVLVFAVVCIMARGGLIGGVAQVEDTGSTSLSRAWQVGWQRFWTLFGIGILVGIPLFVLVLIVFLGPLGGTEGIIRLATGTQQGAPWGTVVRSIARIIPFICGLAIVFAFLMQVGNYAEQAAILEGLNYTAAFGRGWEVLREHLRPTLVLWLIMLLIGIANLAVIGVLFLPVLLAAFALGNGSQAQTWVWLPVCGWSLVALVVGATLGSAVQTFTSATWTLAYRQMTGLRPGPALSAPLASEG